MERAVGEEFEYKEVLLKVEEQIGCTNCYYDFQPYIINCASLSIKKIRGKCLGGFRKDKTSVIFKRINE